LNNGKAITTELFFAGDMAVSFSNYTLQKPSKEFVQVIADVSTQGTNQKISSGYGMSQSLILGGEIKITHCTKSAILRSK